MCASFMVKGRADGIGNRIEELLNIQAYCKENDLHCVYVWSRKNRSSRNYIPCIKMDRITIQEDNRCKLPINNEWMGKIDSSVIDYKFTFDVDCPVEYDVIIHVRGGDRLRKNIVHKDYSSVGELCKFIDKTIEYVNKNDDISSYTVVTDDMKYKTKMIDKITKRYVELPYKCGGVSKDWLDFYYLTRPKKCVIMCSVFSSYSITASILGRKPLLVFSKSLETSLPRYKADIKIIDV